MTRHLEKSIDKLKKGVLALSAIVEENVYRAVRAVAERNTKLADEIIQGDMQVDQMEVDLEEECLKTLALNQPVADDLRFIVAVLKMNNDLERIGDLAVNIARRTHFLAGIKANRVPLDLDGLAEKVKVMLRTSLEALINLDDKLAQKVLASDDEVDRLNREAVEEIKRRIKAAPDEVEVMICFLGVARALERIGDHCTNIAEDVIYLIQGEIVRHTKGHAKKKKGRA
jgi:phosphate transport system protein